MFRSSSARHTLISANNLAADLRALGEPEQM
jgi:hypothetical protein